MMDGQDNRLELERYLQGALDSEQEYEIHHEDVVIDMPQSGERIRGRDNLTHENEVRKLWETCGSSSWCKAERAAILAVGELPLAASQNRDSKGDKTGTPAS